MITFSTAENPVDIVNLLNRYFYSVFKHSDTTDDHFSSVAPDNDTTDLTTISDISLTEEEVCVVLKALDEAKATGPYKIPASLLKNCAVNISSSLCQLFNKSLSCGILPSEWKLANISPIPKRNPIHDVTNYRPISLLLLVSKVFERCIYNRLIEHVYGQIYELQYVFSGADLQHRSCYTFSIKFLTYLSKKTKLTLSTSTLPKLLNWKLILNIYIY